MNKTTSNTLLQSLILALLPALAYAQQVYCRDGRCYNTATWSCNNGWCYSSYYRGYVCCSSWYGSGWAIALWVFLCFILIACCIWCCIAASSPRTYYAEPAVEVVTIKTGATQPQTVVQGNATTTRANAGDAQYIAGGTYTVTGKPVNPSDEMNASLSQGPVQGEPVNFAAAPVAAPTPAAQPVNVNVNMAPAATTGGGGGYPPMAYGASPAQGQPVNAYPQVSAPSTSKV